MNTWTIIIALTPYGLGLLYILFYFLKEKSNTLTGDHDIVMRISSADHDLIIKMAGQIDKLDKSFSSLKGHLHYNDHFLALIDRWINNIVSAIRQLNIFHKNNHHQDTDIEELLQRPPMEM